MLCKFCNTRIPVGRCACPNCGGKTLVAKEPLGRPLSPAEGGENADLELDKVLEPASVEIPEGPSVRVLSPQETAPIASPFHADPATLRRELAEKPDLLEKGLSVYTNEERTPVGVGYSTAVGDIDLLARDASESLVVVIVAERHQGTELVGEVLQRIGWVRRHLGGGSPVRGIVVLEQPPENLSYAAAAVTDTISFKTYRVMVAFEDVEL